MPRLARAARVASDALLLLAVLSALCATCTAAAMGYAPRVVGGRREFNRDVIRWQVLILRNGKVHCGGTLLARNKVLTAAHCDVHERMAAHTVVVGHARFQHATRHPVVRVYNHPDYRIGARGQPVNDVAVVEFHPFGGTDLSIEEYPALNNDTALPRPAQAVSVSGFGQTAQGTTSSVLLTAHLRTISRQRCAEIFSLPMARRVCAGAAGVDSCLGDSGGALYSTKGTDRWPGRPTRYVVWGIVSFGVGCAQPGMPGIYASVADYSLWILQVLARPDTPFDASRTRIIITVLIVVGAVLLAASAVFLVYVLVRMARRSGEDPKKTPWFTLPSRNTSTDDASEQEV